jgi:N-acetylmuramoyl-L-alanine amidase
MRTKNGLSFWFICACLLQPGSLAAKVDGPTRKMTNRIVIHAISGPLCRNGAVAYSGAPGDVWQWKRFFDAHPFLGVHYIIDRKGQVAASTPDNLVANHALDHNDDTVGIELVHSGDGVELFGEEQIGALINLLKDLTSRYKVDARNIVSHSEIDKRTFVCGGRTVKGRTDPGENFPWTRVREALSDQKQPKLIHEPVVVAPPRRAH